MIVGTDGWSRYNFKGRTSRCPLCFGTDIFWQPVGDNVVNMVHKPLADGGSRRIAMMILLIILISAGRNLHFLTYDLIYRFTCVNWDTKGKCNCY